MSDEKKDTDVQYHPFGDDNTKPDYIYEILDKDHPDQPTGKYGIDFPAYAAFLKDRFSVVFFNNTLFIYDNGEHLYREHTNEIGTEIQKVIDEWGIAQQGYSHVLSELTTRLKNKGSYAKYPFNSSPDAIPVLNGIVRINYNDGTIVLLPHSPVYRFTYKLSVEYDPKMRPCNAIMLLKRMVNTEDIKTLIQIPAQALLQMQTRHAYKKAYLLQGDPNAGKTSYLKLLYEIFGADFRGNISLQELCDERFIGGALEGKLLNIYDDLEDIGLNTIGKFKNLTGDCNHDVERKHKNRYTGVITAVHVFSCNSAPSVPERAKLDAAYWQRWEYLKFPFWYEINPNFYSEWYTSERISAFFNLILAAMIHIRKNGLLTNSDTQEVMYNWNVSSDPIAAWLNAEFINNKHRTLERYSKKKMKEAFEKYCIASKIEQRRIKKDMQSFSIALQTNGFTPARPQIRGQYYQVFETKEWILNSDRELSPEPEQEQMRE